MWPWEHAAVGYLAYSLSCRYRDRLPSGGTVFAVVFGALLPDLVDKPLAWGAGILPAGRSLGHSLVVAVPFCVAVWLVSRRVRRPELGVAFGIGYLLHLPADVVTPVLYGDEPFFDFLLWPFVPISGPSGLEFDTAQFVSYLMEPVGIAYLVGELLLLGGTALLWRQDGYPGLEPFTAAETEEPGESLSETGK